MGVITVLSVPVPVNLCRASPRAILPEKRRLRCIAVRRLALRSCATFYSEVSLCLQTLAQSPIRASSASSTHSTGPEMVPVKGLVEWPADLSQQYPNRCPHFSRSRQNVKLTH